MDLLEAVEAYRTGTKTEIVLFNIKEELDKVVDHYVNRYYKDFPEDLVLDVRCYSFLAILKRLDNDEPINMRIVNNTINDRAEKVINQSSIIYPQSEGIKKIAKAGKNFSVVADRLVALKKSERFEVLLLSEVKSDLKYRNTKLAFLYENTFKDGAELYNGYDATITMKSLYILSQLGGVYNPINKILFIFLGFNRFFLLSVICEQLGYGKGIIIPSSALYSMFSSINEKDINTIFKGCEQSSIFKNFFGSYEEFLLSEHINIILSKMDNIMNLDNVDPIKLLNNLNKVIATLSTATANGISYLNNMLNDVKCGIEDQVENTEQVEN